MWAARYWGSRHWAQRYWAPQGLTSSGYYWPENYWTGGFWPARYWSHQSDINPFTATQTAGISIATGITLGSVTVGMTNAMTATVTTGLSISATVGINATPSMEFADAFIAAAPLTLPTITCGIAITATPVLGFVSSAGNGYYWAGRYWTANYWAPRYWETQIEFEATVTTGLSVATAISIGATPEQTLEAVIANTLTIDTGLTITEATISFEEDRRNKDAGRSKRKRHQAEIDGELFDVGSKEEAEELFRTLKEAAEKKAAEVLERAQKAEKRPVKKVLADARKALQIPMVSTNFPKIANQVLDEIEELYKDTLVKVEIEARLKKQDEDEELLLL